MDTSLFSNETDVQPRFDVAVDPEHAGLRISVVLVFFATAVVVYLLAALLFPTDSGLNIVGILAALVAATLTTQVVDQVFKQRWLSGRRLRVTDDRIQLVLRDAVQHDIDGAQHVNVLFWRFAITKRTRIPKGWYMMALALHQNDTYLTAYTFIAPTDFDRLPDAKHFVKLTPKKEQTDQDMRLAGQQRRLHTAEDARWNEGAELSQADFAALLACLRQTFPVWMIGE
ncbi:MAG: hypothetical protein H7Y11_15205 [Armatimonadetes bacterium]|nr:hypothetical protein [Anaerolineae bacterium]